MKQQRHTMMVQLCRMDQVKVVKLVVECETKRQPAPFSLFGNI